MTYENDFIIANEFKLREQVKSRIDRLRLGGLVDLNSYLTDNDSVLNGRDAQEIKTSINKEELLKEYVLELKSQNKANSTIREYTKEAGLVLYFLESKRIPIYSVDKKIINEHLVNQKELRNLGDSSYYKLKQVVNIFLKFLADKKYINKKVTSITKGLKRPEPVVDYLNEDDIEKVEVFLHGPLLESKQKAFRYRIIYYLGMDCGLRRREIEKLDWENIDLANMKMNILKSKNSKNRTIGFSEKNKKFLLSYRKITKSYKGAVVRGKHGRRICLNSMQNIVRDKYEKSGVYRDKLTIHSLRHSCAARLYRKGVDSVVISKFLGHKSVDTTIRYLHLNFSDIRKAVIE